MKRNAISKQTREKIALKTNNRCAYCGEPLKKGWHIDHIEPLTRSFKDDDDNYIASCPQCNRFKSVYDIEEFRDELSKQSERAYKTSVNYRFALKYNQIQETKSNIIFYFEKIGLKLKTSLY